MFDSHAHLYEEVFEKDTEGTLKSMAASGIRYVCMPSADIESSYKAVKLAEGSVGDGYPVLYAAAGIHPCSTTDRRRVT